MLKGAIPARYNGRLSSVLDITMKEGNMNEYHGEISLGLIASKFVAEGPLKKGKGSFMITGRRTTLDFLGEQMNSWFLNTKGNDKNNFYFYDINAKLNYILSDKGRIFISLYKGKDFSKAISEKNEANLLNSYNYLYSNASTLDWGNTIASVRYHQAISSNLFSNLTLYYSKYQYNSDEQANIAITSNEITIKKNINRGYNSGINNLGIRLDFDYTPINNIKVKVGGNFINHRYKPGIESFIVDDLYPSKNIDTLYGQKYKSHEYYIYSELEWKLGRILEVNLGLGYNAYSVEQKTFYAYEPRLAAILLINPSTSLKASYSKLNQNVHLLSNNTLGLPTDLWLPATKRVTPQKGNLASLGVYHLYNNAFLISLEGFYKDTRNIIAYKEGTNYFTGSLNWEDKVAQGIGKSYGLEILIQKPAGKTTGSFAYTLSRSQREFKEINGGRIFPYKYDRTHDLSINVNRLLTKRLDVSITWVFATGTAVTVPSQVAENYIYYEGMDNISVIYNISDKINGVRMPAYHRMDIGFNHYRKLKWANRTLSFGLYNAYNRHNPYYLYIYYNNSGPKLSSKYLFPVLPYVSYNLKF